LFLNQLKRKMAGHCSRFDFTTVTELVLEIELQSELNNSRIACRRYRTESSAVQHDIWRTKRRGIREIEDFCSEFQIHPFPKIRALAQGHIGTSEVRGAYRVS
jgi:hypothetical protein